MTADQRPNLTHFLRGRDLAVQMLKEGRALAPSGLASIEASQRDGEPQRNFCRGFIDELRRRPELVEGFSAVLSCALAGESLEPELYSRLGLHDVISGE